MGDNCEKPCCGTSWVTPSGTVRDNGNGRDMHHLDNYSQKERQKATLYAGTHGIKDSALHNGPKKVSFNKNGLREKNDKVPGRRLPRSYTVISSSHHQNYKMKQKGNSMAIVRERITGENSNLHNAENRRGKQQPESYHGDCYSRRKQNKTIKKKNSMGSIYHHSSPKRN